MFTFLFDVCITEFLFNYKIYIQLNGHPLDCLSVFLTLWILNENICSHNILCGDHRRHNNNSTIICFATLFVLFILLPFFPRILVVSLQWWWFYCIFFSLQWMLLTVYRYCTYNRIYSMGTLKMKRFRIFTLKFIFFCSTDVQVSVCMRRRTDI